MANPIVRAYEWLDKDFLLRQYSKAAKKWEDKGRDRYNLALLFDIPAGIGIILSGAPPESLLGGLNLGDSAVGMYNPEPTQGNVVSSYEYGTSMIRRFFRVPVFVGGAGLTMIEGYNFLSGLVGSHNEPVNLDRLSHGIGLLSLASSMYLKDRDPKLLDKQPAWRRALERAGELSDRIRDWVPVPQPQPVPIPVRYETLEDYIR